MAKIVTTLYTLDFTYPPLDDMSDEGLYHFCMQNKHLRIERDEHQQILFLSPAFTGHSTKLVQVTTDLGLWNRKLKSGLAFESSAGFFLPDTSMRSPDAAWISHTRWNALSEEQRKGFAYITPDFVVELASPSDGVAELKIKMEKWRNNGVRLGWLIDANTETVFIYRADGTVSKVEGFDKTLSGKDVLIDFEFHLQVLR